MRTAIASLCVLVALGLSGCTAEMKARAYAGADRDEWQQPERVVAALEIEPGDRVGDLGSGGGYFTFRLAEAVGSSGRVYALDVDAAMNERLEELVAERGAENVEVILAAPKDPNLPEPVDLLFTSNTYHHIDDRQAYFERVANSLRPGGRVAVLEFRDEGFFHSILGHATAADLIRTEMEARATGRSRITIGSNASTSSFSSLLLRLPQPTEEPIPASSSAPSRAPRCARGSTAPCAHGSTPGCGV